MSEENQYNFPPQSQRRQPGERGAMRPEPRTDNPDYKACGKLEGRVAIITGGDSGIGRAVAIAYAKEGADCVLVYLDEHEDARDTCVRVEKAGRKCLLLAGDVGDENFCIEIVRRTMEEFGRLDILVNNAGEQHEADLSELTAEQLERTFRTNIFSMFHLSKAALPHLPHGKGVIINTTSITAYKGHPSLLDYSATKGAITSFTRSLSIQLQDRGIRVNGVAPGPVWTPLIPASFDPDHTAKHGKSTPMGRAGQPDEIAPCYVFLACEDSSFMSGQILHPNGGVVVGG